MVALAVELVFIILWSIYMYFLVLEINLSILMKLIFAFCNLWIMTENNVHFVNFLILKNIMKFGHFWWLNPCTDFEETKGLFDQCAECIEIHLMYLDWIISNIYSMNWYLVLIRYSHVNIQWGRNKSFDHQMLNQVIGGISFSCLRFSTKFFYLFLFLCH